MELRWTKGSITYSNNKTSTLRNKVSICSFPIVLHQDGNTNCRHLSSEIINKKAPRAISNTAIPARLNMMSLSLAEGLTRIFILQKVSCGELYSSDLKLICSATDIVDYAFVTGTDQEAIIIVCNELT